MVKGYLDYIDKQECERRGFTIKNGIIYKNNTLERYAEKGWLEYGSFKYSACDRVSAGNRLHSDFYKSKLETMSANDVSKVRVDGGGSGNLSDGILDARDRFNKACAAIPYEFWGVVSRVCCDDKQLVIKGDSERQKAYARRNAALLLCLGLDRLIEHYRGKKHENN